MMRRMELRPKLACLFLSFGLLASPARAALAPRVLPPDTNGWAQVQLPTASSGQVYTLLASTHLLAWAPIARLHGGDAQLNYRDPATRQFDRRYYVLTNAPKTDLDDWKNQISASDDE